MPSNIIKINNGGKGCEWNVPDSKMDALLEHLKDNGDPFLEPPCKHEHAEKMIPIPLTEDQGELDYEELLDTVQTIANRQPGFVWSETLICLDCGCILEQNEVGIPEMECSHDIERGAFECGACKIDIRELETTTRIRVDGKYDFFFNQDGSYDGNGIENPTEEEIQKYEASQ